MAKISVNCLTHNLNKENTTALKLTQETMFYLAKLFDLERFYFTLGKGLTKTISKENNNLNLD